MNDVEKTDLFNRLRKVMAAYEKLLTCTGDNENSYELYTTHIMKNKKPLFFGGVKINKNFVSYHLMGLYVFPEMVEQIDPKLRALLKGKSCFNVKRLDEHLLDQLERITQRCLERYQSQGYV